MSAISAFDSERFGTLTVYRDDAGREYFRAIDVCSILRHSNPNQALKRFVDEDYVFQFKEETNRSQTANYLAEPGLYQLIFASKTDWAKQFQRWVFEEVLPKLRAEGGYLMENASQQQIIELLKRHPHSDHLAKAIEFAAIGEPVAAKDELWLEDMYRERKLKEAVAWINQLELEAVFPGARIAKRPKWLEPRIAK